MAETVKLPAIGEVKTSYAVAGVAGVAGVVGYAYWRRSRAPVTATAAVVDPNATGVTDYTPPASGNSSGTFNTSGVPTSNDEWSAKVTEALGGAFDQQFIQVTLGKYLARQPLTDAEVDLIGAARAVAGDPPVGGPYTIQHVPPGTTIPPPPTDSGFPLPATQPTTTHTVVAGETMASIVTTWTNANNGGQPASAEQINANIRTIYEHNPYLHGRQVQPGDVIVLPAFARGYY